MAKENHATEGNGTVAEPSIKQKSVQRSDPPPGAGSPSPVSSFTLQKSESAKHRKQSAEQRIQQLAKERKELRAELTAVRTQLSRTRANLAAVTAEAFAESERKEQAKQEREQTFEAALTLARTRLADFDVIVSSLATLPEGLLAEIQENGLGGALFLYFLGSNPAVHHELRTLPFNEARLTIRRICFGLVQQLAAAESQAESRAAANWYRQESNKLWEAGTDVRNS
jgi:vacuolar-type H+-ATPase subunit I/STV1